MSGGQVTRPVTTKYTHFLLGGPVTPTRPITTKYVSSTLILTSWFCTTKNVKPCNPGLTKTQGFWSPMLSRSAVKISVEIWSDFDPCMHKQHRSSQSPWRPQRHAYLRLHSIQNFLSCSNVQCLLSPHALPQRRVALQVGLQAIITQQWKQVFDVTQLTLEAEITPMVTVRSW